ncbi:MAG: helix-turn-helix domain-containing protein, partial [Deltaproteobacteria bacterium]|nr:helix-turn-helix domain-containing protein [Deltaproteobacteria bacterium]
FQFPKKSELNSKPTEEEKIRNALRTCRWKKGDTAQRLGISRSTLWRLMKKYGLQ